MIVVIGFISVRKEDDTQAAPSIEKKTHPLSPPPKEGGNTERKQSLERAKRAGDGAHGGTPAQTRKRMVRTKVFMVGGP